MEVLTLCKNDMPLLINCQPHVNIPDIFILLWGNEMRR